MNALSWAAVSMSLPFLPRGHDLARAHVEADGVARRSLEVLDPLLGLLRHLPEVVLALVRPSSMPPLDGRPRVERGRARRPRPASPPPAARASSSRACSREPAVVAGPAARAGPRPPSRPGRAASRARARSRRAHPGPGLAHDLQEVLVVPEAEQRHAGRRRARYWSGRPKASKGKPRAQSTWWPIRCFFGFTLVRPWVTHMLGRDLVALPQVVGEVAAGRELGLR